MKDACLFAPSGRVFPQICFIMEKSTKFYSSKTESETSSSRWVSENRSFQRVETLNLAFSYFNFYSIYFDIFWVQNCSTTLPITLRFYAKQDLVKPCFKANKIMADRGRKTKPFFLATTSKIAEEATLFISSSTVFVKWFLVPSRPFLIEFNWSCRRSNFF